MTAPLLRIGIVGERQMLQVERVLRVMREGAIEVLKGKTQW